MKTRIGRNRGLPLTLILLAVAGCTQRASNSLQLAAVPAAEPQTVALETAEPADTESVPAPDPTDDFSAADAPVNAVSTERVLPPNVRPDSPLAEAVKLAFSGVEEGVMLAFVTNSASTFNLGSAEIIYLNDIGMPSSVITAMIHQDHMLQQPVLEQASPDIVTANTTATESEPSIALPEQAPGLAQAPPEQESYSGPIEGDNGDFYEALAPYGNWVDVGGYGRCWQPGVVAINSDWRPYFDRGHWVNTDCGWYWLSDYSWGWAPFHYGRWFRHDRLGWCWSPDHVWGPAWVSWRYSNDYCGWGPLPPGASYVSGLGLRYHGHPVGGACTFGMGADWFAFVSTSHVTETRLPAHALPREQVNHVYHHTVPVTRLGDHNHHPINHGVPPENVVAALHRPIHKAIVREIVASAGGGQSERLAPDGRTLTVYHPASTSERQSPHVAEHRAPSAATAIGSSSWSATPVSAANHTIAALPPATQVEQQSQPTRPTSFVLIGSKSEEAAWRARQSAVAHQHAMAPAGNAVNQTGSRLVAYQQNQTVYPQTREHHPEAVPAPATAANPEHVHHREMPRTAPQYQAAASAPPVPISAPHAVPPSPVIEPRAEPSRFSPPPIAHAPEPVHSAPAPEAHATPPPSVPPPHAPPPAPAPSSSHEQHTSTGRK